MPATTSFHLKEPGADRPTVIFILVYAGGKRTKIYTGERLHPDQWDKASQQARVRGRGIDAETNAVLNTSLERMGKLLREYADNSLARGIMPSAEGLRGAVEIQPEPAPAPVPGVVQVFGEYVDRRAATASANTVRNLRQAVRYVAAYEKDLARGVVEFRHLTRGFFDKYLPYLSATVGLADNSLAHHAGVLKTFLRDEATRGRQVPEAYKDVTWHQYEPEIIPLTEAELAQLEAVALDHPSLTNVRALFLLGCYTGLRFSDVVALRPEHDLGDRLRVSTQKTGESVLIPLNPKARPLLDQLWRGEVWGVSNKVLNQGIRQVAALAGITAPVEHLSYRAGKAVRRTQPKFALIGSHTARRTFVTLALEAGLAWEVVMKVTGHKQMRHFQRYIKVTEQRQMEAFGKLWGKEPE